MSAIHRAVTGLSAQRGPPVLRTGCDRRAAHARQGPKRRWTRVAQHSDAEQLGQSLGRVPPHAS
jgi:hypothetical protein